MRIWKELYIVFVFLLVGIKMCFGIFLLSSYLVAAVIFVLITTKSMLIFQT